MKKIKLKQSGREYFLFRARSVKQGAIDEHWIIQHPDTGSTEKITDSFVAKIQERISPPNREVIPFGQISYKVAIETAVLHILRDVIEVDHVAKNYKLKIYDLSLGEKNENEF